MPEKRRERLDQLFRQQPPAVILCRNEELEPFPERQELAKQHGVALLRSKMCIRDRLVAHLPHCADVLSGVAQLFAQGA